jgi:DNA-binding transcriptional LysR family regulator
MNLDFKLLEIFIAIYQTRSVGEAARILKMSQPGISSALNRLRANLSDPLFIKASSGMQPTSRAHDLFDPISKILVQINSELKVQPHFDPHTSTREFNIGLSDIGECIYLPILIQNLEREAPHIRLRSKSLSPKELEEAMVHGEIDFVAGYFPDIKTGQFLHRRVGLHSFACIMSKNNPLAREKLTLKRFKELRHISIQAPGRSIEVFEKFLKSKKIKRDIALHTPHFMSAPIIVSETNLIATVPQALADHSSENNNIVQKKLPFAPPTFQVNVYWHKSVTNDPGNTWLRGIIFDNLTNFLERGYARNGTQSI